MPNSFWLPPECQEGEFVVFPPEERHHILNVLRMRPGDRIDVLCLNHRLVVELQAGEILKGKVISSSEIPPPPLVLDLAQSIPKGRKIEDAIRLCSQIGLRRIIPFFSLRSVPKLDPARTQEKLERWRRIAIQESGVSGLPPLEVEVPSSLREVLALRPKYQLGLFFWENGEKKLKEVVQEQSNPENVLLIVGPEGGFSPEEAEMASRSGFQVVSLGERIFRTEIAGAIASIFLFSHWGGLGE
ncbi:MAG: RsmE family RNA methyltransferase [bacterium]